MLYVHKCLDSKRDEKCIIKDDQRDAYIFLFVSVNSFSTRNLVPIKNVKGIFSGQFCLAGVPCACVVVIHFSNGMYYEEMH